MRNEFDVDVILLAETFYQDARDLVLAAGFDGTVGEPYHSPTGQLRRGLAILFKKELNLEPLPDNAWSHLHGVRISGPGKMNKSTSQCSTQTQKETKRRTERLLSGLKSGKNRAPSLSLVISTIAVQKTTDY